MSEQPRRPGKYPSLPERVASGELTFLRNINQSPWDEDDDETYMIGLIRYVGRANLLLGEPLGRDGTVGQVNGTGVYMLTSVYEQMRAEQGGEPSSSITDPSDYEI